MNKQYYEALDETLLSAKLPNGLTVLVVPKPGFTRKEAYFVTDFGAIHTEFTLDGVHYAVPAGVAHFLEHKMFELPGRDVSAEFAEMGAAVNAFTSYDLTAYYVSCTEHFEDCLRLLLEFVSTPYFPAESVEREMGIIDQEIGMCADEPGTRVFENLTAAMYRRHAIRVPILGTSETIRSITPEVLQACHEAFYHPENMILCVVGDVDADTVKTIAQEVLGQAKTAAGVKADYPVEDMTCPVPLTTDKMDIAMPAFCLGFKCEPLDKGDGAIRQEFVADLAAEVLFGESSRLYLQLYEEGLIDGSFGGGFETSDGCAMLNCGGDSNDPQEILPRILAAAETIQTEGIAPETLMRLKRSAMGRRIRDLDSFDSTCFRLCAYRMADFDYFRFPEIYDTITASEILAFLARVVRAERASLAVIEPIKEDT